MTERPAASSEVVRRRFEGQKRKDTDPELQLRRVLHANGARYRVHYPVPGLSRRSIDVAFPRQRLAVFVDGCFWHGCPLHSVTSKTNTDWWQQKLAANARRDRETDASLADSGWTVVRIWEHELRSDPVDAAQRVLSHLGR